MINKELLCTQLYVNTRVPKKFLRCFILDLLQNPNIRTQDEAYMRLYNILKSLPRKSVPKYLLQVLSMSISRYLPIEISTDLLHNFIHNIDGKIQNDMLIDLFNKFYLSRDKSETAKLIYSHLVNHYSATSFPRLSLVDLKNTPTQVLYTFTSDGVGNIINLIQDKRTNKLYTESSCFKKYLPMTRKYNSRTVTYYCSITPDIKVILDTYQKEGVTDGR